MVLKERYIFPYNLNHFDLWLRLVLGRLHRGSRRILFEMASGAKERRQLEARLEISEHFQLSKFYGHALW